MAAFHVKLKDWALTILAFSVAILIVCVIGLTIQIQRRNNTIEKIEHVSTEMNDILTEFKRAADANEESRLDSREVIAGLKRIAEIQVTLEELRDEIT